MAGPFSYMDNIPQPHQSEPSLGPVFFWDYTPQEPCEHRAASGGKLPGTEINTRERKKPITTTKNNSLILFEIVMIISYLQHLPASLFYSVSSAVLLAGLAAESLRCGDLLEDPGT